MTKQNHYQRSTRHLAGKGATGALLRRTGGEGIPHAVGDLLVAAAREEAHAAASAALCAAVLLAYLATRPGCAGWHPTAQQAAAVQQELQPQVLSGMRPLVPPHIHHLVHFADSLFGCTSACLGCVILRASRSPKVGTVC